MMHRLIGKEKIYLYFLLLFVLLSIHNINWVNNFNNFFKIKKIAINKNIDENLYKDISLYLDNLQNLSIFSIDSDKIQKKLNEFNLLSYFEIKKEYPSSIRIKLKETKIIAYYFEDNKKMFIGENGKKITKVKLIDDDLPIIIGQVNIKKFLDFKNKLINAGFDFKDINKFYSYRSNRWDISYKNKIIIKLPSDELDNSLRILKNIIEKSNLRDVKVIDLRIKKRIIVS